MNHVTTDSKAIFLKQLTDAFEEKLDKAEAKKVTDFVFQFFGGLPMEEITGKRFSDIYGAVLASWKFIQHHNFKHPKVRVFNPDLEEDGWQSTHTVLAVLHQNIPFLVDSVRMALNERELTVHSIQHAVLDMERDRTGNLKKLLRRDASTQTDKSESLMFIEVDRHNESSSLDELKSAIETVVKEVRVAVGDYEGMRDSAEALIKEFSKLPKSIAAADIAEAGEFIKWVVADHFTFLGSVEYAYKKSGDDITLEVVKDSQKGIMKSHTESHHRLKLSDLPKRTQEHILKPDIFTFAKSSERSRVHRPAYPDYISVKKFNAKGEVIGERRFLGLYTAKVYNERPSEIPLLRRKTAEVIERSGLNLADYGGKELDQILSVYPRDELFQINSDELFDVAMGILYVQERRKIRLFMREDAYGRFVSCLVYVPREIYSTDLRRKMEKVLVEAVNGVDIDFMTFFSESVLARTQFSIRVSPVENRELNVAELQNKIIAIAQSWQDGLMEALYEAHGEELANRYIHLYQNAFKSSYKEAFSPRRAVIDIDHIAAVSGGKPLSMSFYRALEEDEKIIHFKLFHGEEPVTLSDVLPIFENMGLRVIGEHPYGTTDRAGNKVWIHDFTLSTYSNQVVDIHKVRPIFEELFQKVWSGEAESDPFNRLVLAAYLNWRQIAMLRSYARYMRQIRVSNSQHFISNTLVNHVGLTEKILALFEARFSPNIHASEVKRKAAQEKIEIDFNEALDNVSNLSEDKILRLYIELTKATLRTNYYQATPEGQEKSYMSFKLSPRLISDIPLPVPMFEIFVYSPRIEGVHLRGGKVARGGLRWSDRYEDYRTEVLGLVKAQQVKNAVIVPVGAKGGFVAKKLPDGDRDAFMKEGVACYQTFIRGLLDVTDNLIEGELVPPKQVVRHDEDDYYLVVAADKGTATFSDIANQISDDYNFWLGDAFASGGSHGYDHKKMGITARGAWVSVERLFREMGHNTATTDFTVVGIGDMAGDVFGNGMLRSKHTRLVAAFNHMHIFVDPNPDAAKSFGERQRLFDLPRSSWEDYDSKLISKGGGVFNRSAKSIPISDEMKGLLGTSCDRMPPNMLISHILKAQVDLIWIGGIGTYFKASSESHNDVGDKANDGLRIDGKEIRAKVVGEGGNLGFTQLARVEFSLAGGRLNTDFIDNAGGVDCSDHEVNIKILLNEVVANGDLTEKQRNKMLSEMTDDVAELVLKNNYRQTQAISIACSDSLGRVEEYRRLINSMEASGKLNRSLEFIPDDEVIAERKALGKGLSRPELSVLISYVKGDLKELITNSTLPDDKCLSHEIELVFPEKLVKKFGKEVHNHKLRREIIATQIANDMVNHMGITFVERLRQSTGASSAAVALAYIIARDAFRLEHWWEQIEALDYRVSSDTQMNMMSELMRLIRRACRWLLRNRRSELNVAANMEKFAKGIQEISGNLSSYLTGDPKEAWDKTYNQLTEEGVPKEIAETVAGAGHLYSALGIIEAQDMSGSPISRVANVYYALGDRLDLSWFGQQLNILTPTTHWQALAREAFREDLDWQQRALTVGVLKMKNAPDEVEKRLDIWVDYHRDLIDRWTVMLSELKTTTETEFSMYSVALRELLDLAQSTAHQVEY
ncbi:NAD-glutamate dehydrogenase [Alkalimarinus sediminis]|uniref:NAD-glutamate dehydrogenase n=1 Tax=Alkalimarinus sediminis TaxID=1632866 RepID=A0A9E8KR14_9ALTE|nr:NAD-glutamate dehydrogenase [Alkalimarinus sediminis]UZW75800.1 NAD-glutamate dehydrogenase [Alkalimarinus sediminis]